MSSGDLMVGAGRRILVIEDEYLVASHRGLPFVVVTGYGNLELPSAALQGAPRVHKPFTANGLTTVLVGAI